MGPKTKETLACWRRQHADRVGWHRNSPNVQVGLQPHQMNLLFNATTIPSALMFAALNEQDLLCRIFGKCRAGDPLDREIGDLIGSVGPLEDKQKLFTYAATMQNQPDWAC